MLAPIALGGGIAGGIAAMLIGGYKITDCLIYRSTYGVCDEVIEDNTLAVVTGVGAIVGSVGGLFTYNKKLERPEASPVASSGALSPPPPPTPEDEPEALLSEEIMILHDAGMSERDIADQLEITRYRVRKTLHPGEE